MAARLVFALLLAGCYAPKLAECTVSCGRNHSCPSGLTCRTEDNFCHASAAAPMCGSTVGFVETFGASGNEVGNALAVDALGALFVGGTYEGAPTLGGPSLPPADGVDLFVAKYDRSGAPVWSRGFGGPGTDEVTALAVDPQSGDVMVTGNVSKRAAFDAFQLQGTDDLFLARLDGKTGAVVWAKLFGGPAVDVARGLAVADGKVVIVGAVQDALDAVFDGNSPVAFGMADLFVAEYSLDGEYHFVRAYGGPMDDLANGVAVGGNWIAVTGLTGGTADLRAGQCVTGCSAWVLKIGFDITTYGQVLASSTFASAKGAAGNAVAVDRSGALLVAGTFAGDLAVTPPAVAVGGTDLFLLKLDDRGSQLAPSWAHAFGGAGDDQASAVASNATNDFIVGGTFVGPVDFGGGPIGGPAGDALVARYGSEGGWIGSRSSGGSGHAETHGLVVAADGSVIATGRFNGSLAFNAPPVESHGNDDLFLVNLKP
jgi:hypothetical protein